VPAVGVGREGRPDEGGKFPDPGIAVMEVLRETIRGPKTWGSRKEVWSCLRNRECVIDHSGDENLVNEEPCSG